MKRYTIRGFKYGDTDCPMARLQEIEDKIEDGVLVERQKGEWEYEPLDKFRKYRVDCPFCKAYYIGNYDAYDEPCDFNYCPECGAKMDGERSEGNE